MFYVYTLEINSCVRLGKAGGGEEHLGYIGGRA